MSELVREDAAVEADGDGLRDVRLHDEVEVRAAVLAVERLHDADDDEGGFVADGDHGGGSGCGHDHVALIRRRGDADDPDLDAQRDHDQDGDDKGEDGCGDGGVDVGFGDARGVLGELRVGVPEGAGHEAAEEDAADCVGDETQGIDDEDAGLALLSAGQER